MPKFHVCAQIHMPRCFLPLFMFRSIFLCAPCHAYAQIYLFICSLPCLCAPCHVYAQIYIFVCSIPCSCFQIYMPVAMLYASKAFLSLVIPFSYVLARVDLDLVVQVYIHTPRPISKGLDHFLYTCVCLLASILYIHVCLSRFRLCHALCPPRACACQSLRPLACVVAFAPLMDCLGVTTCEMHLRGVGLLDAYPFFASCNVVMLALLALCHPFSFLCFFAFLHTCLHVHS